MEEKMLPSINVLTGSDLIISEDVKFLQEHTKDFEKRFRTRGLFRSKIEMEAGVLNEVEHPTVDSKYWQAIGEQNVHLTELITLDFESKKLSAKNELIEVEIDELEDLISKEENKFKKKKLEIKLKEKRIKYEQNKFNLIQQTKTAQERMREVKTWESIIKELEPLLKYGDEDFSKHHAERYYLKFKNKMNNLELMEDSAKEMVVNNFNSFASHPDNKNIENRQNLSVETTQQIDYRSYDEAKKDDPIIAGYFDRKVRTIMVCSPHRNKGDRNATNFNMMQTPTGFNCFLNEPFGMTVPDARNFAVQKAISEDIDYIFFVDDDCIIPRDALVKLVHHKADMVGGFYYKKYLPLESVGMHINEKDQPISIDDYKIGDIIHNTLVLPSGCTLINVKMLKKIEVPWYKSVTISGRAALTEDTYICQKVKDIGVDIITDTGIQCVHVDYTKGMFYGHPLIVNYEDNTIRAEYREYFAL
ncbi:MAG: hypothetical protein WCZ11_04190 [Bacilli bacterium]